MLASIIILKLLTFFWKKFSSELSFNFSIEESLRALQIDSIALLHIHNATPEILRYISVQDALSEAQSQGKIQHIGATCYQEEGALAVMDCPLFSVIQVPFNLLNQQMSQRVFPEASKRNIGIFVRSAFLRGVLTYQINSLPSRNIKGDDPLGVLV